MLMYGGADGDRMEAVDFPLKPGLAAVGAAVVVLAAGCGGNGTGDDEATADVDALSVCLSDVDKLSSHAVGKVPLGKRDEWTADADGVLKIVRMPADPLTGSVQEIRIVAEGSAGDASAAAGRYEAIEWVVEQHGTVVVASTDALSDEERTAIEGCLDEQGIG